MKSSQELKAIMEELVHELPRNDWIAHLDTAGLTASDLSELDDLASGAAVVYAEVSELAGMLGGYGLGRQDDKAIKKRIAAKVKAVRKALGYTYP
jgi:hypothetical protein